MEKGSPEYLKVHAHSGVVSLLSPLDYEMARTVDFYVHISRMDFIGG